jgi:hypothetical protein
MTASRREQTGGAASRGYAGMTRRELIALGAFGLAAGLPEWALAAPQGQLTWGAHISLAPTWFDPAETSGIITRCTMR